MPRQAEEVLAEGRAFQEAIEYFIRACPGPPMAERGLRIVAYQPIRGLTVPVNGETPNTDISRNIGGGGGGGDMSLRLWGSPRG